MTGKIEFSAICPGFTVRIGLEHLSARDKIELFRTLMDQLGITERLTAEADATARAQQIIVEQWTAHWGAAS